MEQQPSFSSRVQLKQFILGVLATAACCLPSVTAAQENMFPEPTAERLTWSARACYVEATWSLHDCSALLHVIRKRATKYKWPFLKMLKAYSTRHWQGKKGKEAKTLTLASVKNKDVDWNRNWFKLTQFVKEVFDHNVQDPCPKADHWAAKYFPPTAPMKPARCSVKLDNAFYVSVKQR